MKPTRPPLHLPDVFLDYRCNLRGCCCGGWAIPFRDADLARARTVWPELTLEQAAEPRPVVGVPAEPGHDAALFLRETVTDGAGFTYCTCCAPDPTTPDRWLCQLQARGGVDCLPTTCACFPVRLYPVAGQLELHFEPLCPVVLELLLAGTGPLAVARVTDWSRLQVSLRWVAVPEPDAVRVGARRLPMAEAVKLRRWLLARMNDRARPVSYRLAELDALLARLGEEELAVGDGEQELAVEVDEAACSATLFRLLEELPVARLAAEAYAYRRFLPPEFREPLQHPARLLAALADWPEHLAERLLPVEEQLQPYLARFCWVQLYHLLHVDPEQPALTAEPLLRLFALSLQTAATLAALLDRPVDRPILAAALGLASFVHHHPPVR